MIRDLIERAALGEDLVRDRDLADVVKLGGPSERDELAGREAELTTHGQGEALDGVDVLPELRRALVDDPDQDGLDLAPRGPAPRVLVRVHPLIGELKCCGSIARLHRELRRPV